MSLISIQHTSSIVVKPVFEDFTHHFRQDGGNYYLVNTGVGFAVVYHPVDITPFNVCWTGYFLGLREVVSDSVGDNTGSVTAMAITLFQPVRLFPFNSFAG